MSPDRAHDDDNQEQSCDDSRNRVQYNHRHSRARRRSQRILLLIAIPRPIRGPIARTGTRNRIAWRDERIRRLGVVPGIQTIHQLQHLFRAVRCPHAIHTTVLVIGVFVEHAAGRAFRVEDDG